MTIQGAISELQNLLGADDIPFYYKTAIEKVIETIMDALKREPSEDLINRAEAVKRLLLCKQSRAKIVSRYDMGFVDGLSHAINILDLVPLVYIPSINIKDLAPSADRPRPIDPTIKVDLESGVVPRSACEPKAPKTIIYADRIYAERPKGRWHYSDGKPATIGQSFGVICDQCGAESEYCTNFCPNCGADMRGEEE